MKTYRFLLAFSFSLLFSLSIQAQQTSTIRGLVQEARTQTPVPGATVQIVGTDFRTIADENGAFSFTAVPVGRLELKITSVAFSPQLIKELILVSNKELIVNVQLEPSTETLKTIDVKAASPNLSGAKTSLQSITIEQVMRYPATFFDPARLAFSLPGVANTNDQANGMSIRGNNPRGLQWRLEGVEIVNPNHLANAGTFSDQVTVNAGGTNMLSAQMLGNMNFLSGAFPAEYGNALSGVMDMRLRKGNNKNHEHTVQVGLIGVDLATEGPINKEKGSSYLVNYRYSFTGLLALGGMTFGGEAIAFQDLAVNLSFPSKTLGEFTVFGMGGLNSNEFKFDDEDGLGPETEKDLYNINYHGKMGAVGMTQAKTFGGRLHWRNALVYSSLQTKRDQTKVLSASSAPSLAQIDDNTLGKLSLSSIFSIKATDKSFWKAGVYFTQNDESLFANQVDVEANISGLIIQPFVEYDRQLGKRVDLTLGLHSLNYSYNNQSTLEPRMSLALALNESQDLNLALGRYSQIQGAWAYAFNKDLKPTLSDQVVLHYEKRFGTSSTFTAEAFGQFLHQDLSFSDAEFLVGMNISGNYLNFAKNYPIANGSKGRTYGLELNYNKYLDKGFFALINTTLYKSQFRAFDENYYDSRYSGNYIFNVTLGKEWTLKKNRVLGLNTRIVWLGGFRDYAIDEGRSEESGQTVFAVDKPLDKQYPDYFRPDLRLYLKRSKAKINQMWSVDIQNFVNYQNVAYDAYDAFQQKIVRKYQLGMVPMLNYRIEF
ncbi:TonB-dependent receptor [Marinilongibacter aquaticus]|uniref:TonB-dependent receptor n=1 Tax=Marinilongibacter aquaticus TaxID=2975157 RepID=UPI0021BD1E69|nr:TonB-dependent receptor [Marinilongibacter aquaticus]UBM60294.1 TonB-dependent receptor [Marinilongibacter aquaticus]